MATAATEWLEAMGLLLFLVRGAKQSKLYDRARSELTLAHAIRQVAALGIPTGLQFGSEMLAFATFTAMLATLGPEQVAAHQIALAIITSNDNVAGVTRTLLAIAAAFQVLDAVGIVLRGALRGAKDVRVPAVIGVVVIWTCVPNAALLLGRLAGWGSAGGWIGFVAETALGAALFDRRWRHGAWRRAYEK